MSQHIEKELKTQLTLEHYLYLKRYFKVNDTQLLHQENYYFDTIDNQLKQLGIGLRFRFENQTCEFTMKINHKKHEKIEITDTINNADGKYFIQTNTFPKGEVTKKLNALNVDYTQLIQIGQLKNKRYEINIPDGIFALDKSYFKTGITYELEFEYHDNPDFFFNFLEKHRIPYQSLPSKLSRALQ